MLVYSVNLDLDPVVYAGWRVVNNQTGGVRNLSKESLAWDFVCDFFGKAKQNVLSWNDSVRNFLEKRQYLIPKTLICFKLCFFGTEYEKDGRRLIKYLYWSGICWESDFHYLDEPFSEEFIHLYFK